MAKSVQRVAGSSVAAGLVICYPTTVDWEGLLVPMHRPCGNASASALQEVGGAGRHRSWGRHQQWVQCACEAAAVGLPIGLNYS